MSYGKKGSRILLVLAAVVVLAAGAAWFFGAKIWPARARILRSMGLPADSARMSPREARLVLKIDGMDCIMCAGQLQNSLRQIPGVLEAEVSFQDKEARVSFNPQAVGPPQLEQAIAKSGFKVAQAGR